MTSILDQVTLVDEQDNVVGVEDKFVAHVFPAKLHRAISVWMVDEQGRLLLQQRSPQKIVGANWWGNTVCGNVWPEESYEACAFRRLKVELGIQGASLSAGFKFHYQSHANNEYGEHEMDQVFYSQVLSTKIKVEPNPVEVSDYLWVEIESFFEQVDAVLSKFEKDKGRKYPTAQETVSMSAKELEELTPPLAVQFGGRELLVVPWTLLMVQFSELRQKLTVRDF